MQIGDVLNSLKKVKVSGKDRWIALCPGHDDHNPSLHIAVKEGKILLKCHAGCETEAVVKAMGVELSDLFIDSGRTPKSKEIIAASRAIAEYDYKDEEGNVLYQVVRMNPKAFLQRHRNGNREWVWNLKGVRKVPYHLPEVIKADTVYLCEGEKDADNLMKRGLVATTSPGGANAWSSDYARYFEGKKVVIIPDKDEPGYAYARAVAESLTDIAREVKVVTVPGDAKDYSDWMGDVTVLVENEMVQAEAEVTVTEEISGYHFEWADLSIRVRRVDVHKDGRITGELIIMSGNMTLLPATQVNFSAARTRKELANDLQKKYKQWEWQGIFDYLATEVQERARSGDTGKLIEVNAVDVITPPEYILEPLILEGLPSVLFGDKGANKTTVSLLATACISLPWIDNPLGFEVSDRPMRVAFLDWESSYDIIKYTILKLRKGMNIPYFEFAYRRCRFSFYDDIEPIQRFLDEHKIDVVIIDSLGAACGGDLFKPEPALKFFEALRQTARTSLILAQNAKGEENKKSIYGSAYFSYYARNIFEAKRSDRSDDDRSSIGLFHKEANYSKLYKPIGLSITFGQDTISVEPEELSMGDFSDRIRQSLIVEDFLRDGPKSVRAIANELELNDNATRALLSRMKKRGDVVNVSTGMWGLATKQ